MKASSYSLGKVKEKFELFFDKAHINRVSKNTGFVVRKGGKITGFDFAFSLILCFCKKKNTFSEWAWQLGLLSGKRVTKQALFNRTDQKAAAFCKQLLEDAVTKKAVAIKASSVFQSFRKVLLQDSTTNQLPDCLATIFAGNHSGGVQKAVVRIQTILDLKTMQFVRFSLSGFTRNDQAASGDILPLCCKGDLVIRDLGYFALATFRELTGKGVHFLSRLRFGVKMYEPDGTEILLSTLLNQKQKVDKRVLIGMQKIPVRLVMLPVPEKIAAEKKRKARNDRDQRINHSKEYYEWLEFNTYITSVDEAIWTTEQVMEAYRVRWQIELVFKSWKSGGLHMQQLLHDRCANAERVKICIYLMLLFVTLFCRKLYLPVLNKMTKSGSDKMVSMIKMLAWVVENIIEALNMTESMLHKIVFEKCSYEKRNERENIIQTIMKCKR